MSVLATAAGQVVTSAKVLRLGLRPGERPDRLPRALWAMRPFGQGLLGGIAASCARYPEAVAVHTPTGSLTYGELWREAGLLAAALRRAGVDDRQRVGLLARNDVFFVLALVATARLGVDVVLLNTASAPPQQADVVLAEGLELVLCDDDLAAGLPAGVVWPATHARGEAARGTEPVGVPRRHAETIVLTSGTTGRPKGARRPTSGRRASSAAQAFAAELPWSVRSTVVVPAPFFHAWGLAGLLISLSLSATVVTRPAFDAEGTLADVATHRADVLVAVPVMVQRIVRLAPELFVQHDTSSLRAIVSSGSALPVPVVTDVLRRFGPILHSVYGSTEVSATTIARPADLARDPATAGRPAPGVRVAILDADGHPVPRGRSGRIFVGSSMTFHGYTAGDGKATVGDLVSSGDLGWFDRYGCLRVDGREDDMVVSGGENVYPGEVEDLLVTHPAVAEAVVAGRDDDEFGRALHAWVVPVAGAEVDEEELRSFVRERLAPFKVPRRVVLVDDLPRTATGKVIRRLLA